MRKLMQRKQLKKGADRPPAQCVGRRYALSASRIVNASRTEKNVFDP